MINQNTSNALSLPTLSSYFNDIAMHFYEDSSLMTSIGLQYGFDVTKDYFLALSFLYPSTVLVSYEKKCSLGNILDPIIARSPLNNTIKSHQFLTCDKGTMIFLISHSKEDLKTLSTEISNYALELLMQNYPEDFIRIGIGSIETGLSGIERSYRNSLNAVNAGEKFKKERRILDFIGMEIYSVINAMILAHGESLISTILLQISPQDQVILGKYYKCKKQISATAAALNLSESDVQNALLRIKKITGLDVNDSEDSFKLNFVMIAKRVLEKEKEKK